MGLGRDMALKRLYINVPNDRMDCHSFKDLYSTSSWNLPRGVPDYMQHSLFDSVSI